MEEKKPEEQFKNLIRDYAEFHYITEQEANDRLSWIGKTESLKNLGVEVE